MRGIIIKKLEESIDVKKRILENEELIDKIQASAEMIINTLRDGGKVLICGNGGSAADAQHIAGELLGKFYMIRRALPAIALNTNTSVITAIGNDTSFDEIFSRQVEALGTEKDVLMAISTSGNSRNVIKAIEKAKEKGMKVIGLTGRSGGMMRDICDVLLNVPSQDTLRVQESHITIGHIICEIVEKKLFAEV